MFIEGTRKNRLYWQIHTRQRSLKIPPYPHLFFQSSTHPGICLNLFQPLAPVPFVLLYNFSASSLSSRMLLLQTDSFSFLSVSLHAVSYEEIPIYFHLKTSSYKSCTQEYLEEQTENALAKLRPMKKELYLFLHSYSEYLAWCLTLNFSVYVLKK